MATERVVGSRTLEEVKELRGQSTGKVMDTETSKNFEKVVLERVTLSQKLKS